MYEVIKEYFEVFVKYAILNRGAGEAVPEARDIVAVFADDIELQRVSGGVGAGDPPVHGPGAGPGRAHGPGAAPP